jgi:hypothetical protein
MKRLTALLVVLMLVTGLAVGAMAAKVKFAKMEDYGQNVGNGTWDDLKGIWVPGTATENWLCSHKQYKNFILEFDATTQGRTLILVRSTINDVPYYFGAGIDMVSPTDIRLRRWTEGVWQPSFNTNAQVLTSFVWGDSIHFKVTVKGDLARFEITDENKDLIIDEELELDEFKDAGYIWIRSLSTTSDTIIENLTIEELN